MTKISQFFDFDWILITAVGFLLTSGLVAIYSLSLGGSSSAATAFEKQMVFLAIGLVVFGVVSHIDYRIWRTYVSPLYLSGIVLLIAVLFLGKNIRGSSGWFSFGFFNFQPVELVKIIVIITLAKYFSSYSSKTLRVKHILVSLIYVAIPVLLAARQPDMGAAMVMIVIWLGMIFLRGLKKKHLVVLAALAIIFPLISWQVLLHDYQKARINSFLNPQADPLGSGYNVIQSMVAVGSGGIWGKGLGHGSQSRLNFLPEKHTDFIFAAIAEESGLVGALIVMILFGVLIYRMKITADRSRDVFGQMIVGGIILMIFFQIVINVGMNLGVMPVAGLALPLLSYGGSFLISTLICLGLVQSIWKRRKKRVSMMAIDSAA
jgi:rod shape determining protein RodA